MASGYMNLRGMRVLALALMLLVLQQLVVSRWSIFDVHPDLLLFACICCGIGTGSQNGAIAGFAAGLASDVFSLTSLGVGALAYAVAGYFAGSMAKNGSGFAPAVGLIAFIATGIALGVYSTIGSVIGDFDASVLRIFWVTLVTGVLNAVLSPFAVRLLRRSPSLTGNAW